MVPFARFGASAEVAAKERQGGALVPRVLTRVNGLKPAIKT